MFKIIVCYINKDGEIFNVQQFRTTRSLERIIYCHDVHPSVCLYVCLGRWYIVIIRSTLAQV